MILIPLTLCQDGRLNSFSKILYGRLRAFAEDGRCNPTHERLAHEVRASPRRVQRALYRLRATGWIAWERGRDSCHYVTNDWNQPE